MIIVLLRLQIYVALKASMTWLVVCSVLVLSPWVVPTVVRVRLVLGVEKELRNLQRNYNLLLNFNLERCMGPLFVQSCSVVVTESGPNRTFEGPVAMWNPVRVSCLVTRLVK